MLQKIDWDYVNQLNNEKYIDVIKHPDDPNLFILDYSRRAQFDQFWNLYTLSCRGLVVNKEGKIIARSMKKFFNLSEVSPDVIPKESFIVNEKLDGSCIITYFHNGIYKACTRGSFKSDQANEANKILIQDSYQRILKDWSDYTFIFEYISPTNRIVVPYTKTDLVLLAVINIETGDEKDISKFENYFTVAKEYQVKDLPSLSTVTLNDDEGVVIKFKSNYRLKLKNAEYVRLHKILTTFSNRSIWDALKNNQDLSIVLENVPDEFDSWVREKKKELEASFNDIKVKHEAYFKQMFNEDRKTFAVSLGPDFNKAILFALYDKKDPSKIIWDMIRPKYERPFSIDEV